MIENLICSRVVASENDGVMTAEFTASEGAYVTMRLDMKRFPADSPDRPIVGAVYSLVPRDGESS